MLSTASFHGNWTGARRGWDLGPGTRSPGLVQTLENIVVSVFSPTKITSFPLTRLSQYSAFPASSMSQYLSWFQLFPYQHRRRSFVEVASKVVGLSTARALPNSHSQVSIPHKALKNLNLQDRWCTDLSLQPHRSLVPFSLPYRFHLGGHLAQAARAHRKVF